MVKLPLNFEAKLDTVIWALRASNLLADNTSMDILKGVGADTTEAERAALAASLNYSVVGGGGRLTSEDNIDLLFDSADDNPSGSGANYFRVGRGQDTVPLTVGERELFVVEHDSAAGPIAEAYIGPRPSFLTNLGAPAHGTYKGYLQIGSEFDAVNGAYPLFQILQLTGVGSILNSRDNLLISTDTGSSIQITTDADLKIGDGFNVFGGWINGSGQPQFYVGQDPVGLGGPEQFILIEKTQYTGGEAWRMLVGDNTQEWDFFLSGSYPAYFDDARVRFCVGGVPGEGNKDPSRIVLFGDNYVAQSMVVTPELSEKRMGLWVYSRGPTYPNDTHLVNFHTAMSLTAASDTIRLFSVSGGFNSAPFYRVAFSVRADSSCSSPGGFFTEPADLAEYFSVPNERVTYTPGTVMVVEMASGILVPSSSEANPAVVGVVSTEPGMGLGRFRDDPEKELRTVPIAMSGTVPTRVTTSSGSIGRMDLLVSAPNGMACKAPDNPPPGSVIGKAMEVLNQPGEEVIEGIIKVLVWRN